MRIVTNNEGSCMPKKKKKKRKLETRRVRKPQGILEELDIKPRMCLKCSKEFESNGPGNRLCRRCGSDNRFARVKSSYKVTGCGLRNKSPGS